MAHLHMFPKRALWRIAHVHMFRRRELQTIDELAHELHIRQLRKRTYLEPYNGNTYPNDINTKNHTFLTYEIGAFRFLLHLLSYASSR